jgi:hypothetical protein
MPKLVISKSDVLNLVVEKDQFILDQEKLYCIRENCKGCKYEDSCNIIEDPLSTLEPYINKATRDNIRFGRVDTKDWISVYPKSENIKHYKLENNLHYIDDWIEVNQKTKKDTFLALNNKAIFKKVDIDKIGKLEDYLLYKEEDESYYCVRKCQGCKYQKICEPELIEERSEKVFTAIDSSSQEPQIIAYLSKEPKYIEIFKNNSLKDIPYLYQPISWIVEDVLDIDPESHKGSSFIDYVGFEDKTILYEVATVLYSNLGEGYNNTQVEGIVDKVKKLYKKYMKIKDKKR